MVVQFNVRFGNVAEPLLDNLRDWGTACLTTSMQSSLVRDLVSAVVTKYPRLATHVKNVNIHIQSFAHCSRLRSILDWTGHRRIFVDVDNVMLEHQAFMGTSDAHQYFTRAINLASKTGELFNQVDLVQVDQVDMTWSCFKIC